MILNGEITSTLFHLMLRPLVVKLITPTLKNKPSFLLGKQVHHQIILQHTDTWGPPGEIARATPQYSTVM